MPHAAPEWVHATAVAVDGRAALIFGASGAGKSDLALRCLALPTSELWGGSALLVSDDQVRLERDGDVIRASAPPTLRGKLEVRGIGIVEVPVVDAAVVALTVDLCAPAEVERMPEPAFRPLLGLDIPLVRLAPFLLSTPIQLLLALHVQGGRRFSAL